MPIYIPEKIVVGFQNRKDTYTGKLGYVIYYGPRGALRKKASWNSWRNQKIESVEFDNVPIEGFVLNKKAGGVENSYSSWNTRKSYARVWDSRDFEFEISIPNLLYILENTDCTRGKGLEGLFVYGWDGTELILIPENAPDYKELMKYSDLKNNPIEISKKTLKLGGKYLTDRNKEVVYLGHHMTYHEDSWNWEKFGTEKGKRHIFRLDNDKDWGDKYILTSALKRKIILVVDEEPDERYSRYMDELQGELFFSPYDPSKDEYVPHTYESFVREVTGYRWSGNKRNVFVFRENVPVQAVISGKGYYSEYNSGNYVYEDSRVYFRDFYGSLPDLFSTYDFFRKIRYNALGKVIKS